MAYAVGMTNQLIAVIGLVALALLLAAGWVFNGTDTQGFLGIVVGLIGGILVPSPIAQKANDAPALKPAPPAAKIPEVPND